MMKSLKSKLAIGVVATSLVAGMGTAFAAKTDAGAQLQTWYTTASGLAKAAVTGNLNTYYGTKTEELKTTVTTGINSARTNIAATGRAELAGANKAINDQNGEYLGQINSAKTAINNSIENEYDSFVSTTNDKTNTDLAAVGVKAEKDIANAVRNHENYYSNNVLTPGVATTSTKAQTDLNTAISTTKSNLNGSITTQSEIAATEVTTNLNNTIGALETQLANSTSDKQIAAQGRISTLADKLEGDALDELDAIVQGITAP
ncbi:hypothetical protein ASG89_21665 [Paenibacillus sp. Soil766]|uniref:hypothetical protein n=1 Tax=Paenibacillus sp. Soil766 TaxID=1736404 RepID=UPI00070F13BE|nr:hypothetical protein [Paenibacillus sp. Soil766]KRF04457.1 hypothetical protein ASG89_21665 [Paenibacillus sp. Soil766]